MAKKILVPLAFAAVVAMGYVSYGAYGPQSEEDALLFENVEALAGNDVDKCHNPNGYKEWYVYSGPHCYDGKKEFQNCCYKDKSGYCPSGNCN